MPKLIRVTTVPMALKYLLAGQMKYMKQNGFDVLMVSADGIEREGVIRNEGIPHIIIPMTRKITPFADLKSLWLLYKLFVSEKPDIIHSHTPKAGLLAMLAGKLAGIKIRVHTVAGLRFVTATGKTRSLLVQMEKLTGRWSTNVWPNSFSMRDYILEHKLAPVKKIKVIGLGSSNGIDLTRFSTASLRQDRLDHVKLLMRYDKDLQYLLCVGRIVQDKGIEELTLAFTRLYEENNRLRLVLVGTFEDELDPVNEETRKTLTSHPGVILTGWSDEVEYFMHLSFALIHPSHREGFPNVLLQAGAMLCPAICSRIDGNIDIIEHGSTGLIFNVKDKEDLYAKIRFALQFPDKVKEYAHRLRVKIEQHFDQKVVHRRVEEAYRQLLESQGSKF